MPPQTSAQSQRARPEGRSPRTGVDNLGGQETHNAHSAPTAIRGARDRVGRLVHLRQSTSCPWTLQTSCRTMFQAPGRGSSRALAGDSQGLEAEGTVEPRPTDELAAQKSALRSGRALRKTNRACSTDGKQCTENATPGTFSRTAIGRSLHWSSRIPTPGSAPGRRRPRRPSGTHPRRARRSASPESWKGSRAGPGQATANEPDAATVTKWNEKAFDGAQAGDQTDFFRSGNSSSWPTRRPGCRRASFGCSNRRRPRARSP